MKLTTITFFELLTEEEKERFRFKERDRNEFLATRLEALVAFLEKDKIWHVVPKNLAGYPDLERYEKEINNCSDNKRKPYMIQHYHICWYSFFKDSTIYHHYWDSSIQFDKKFAGTIKDGGIYPAHPELLNVLEKYEFR